MGDGGFLVGLAVPEDAAHVRVMLAQAFGLDGEFLAALQLQDQERRLQEEGLGE